MLFNYLLFNHHLKQNQIMEDLGKKIAHYMITSFHYCVVDISCSFLSSYLQSDDGLKRKDFYRQRWSSLQVFHLSKKINQECQQYILVRVLISLIGNAAIWSGTSLTTCAMRGSCCQIIFRLEPSIPLLAFDIERSQKKIGILNSSLNILYREEPEKVLFGKGKEHTSRQGK